MKQSLLFATSNKGKINECNHIIELLDIAVKLEIIDQKYKEPVEDGNTYEENSLIKAKYYATLTNKITISDDSGLEVNALNKFPGLISARWAKEVGGISNAMDEIIKKLDNIEDRSAQFVCCFCLYNPQTHKYKHFTGVLKGSIANDKVRGEYGFGYDPIFIPEGYTQALSTLTSEEKNKISHRKKALTKLLSEWK